MTMASREISRLTAIFATILLIQIAVVPHFRIGGYIIDLPLVVVVLVCLHLNPPNAALVGFIVGFAIDLVVHTPFGMTALTFSIAGYVAGSASSQLTERNIVTRTTFLHQHRRVQWTPTSTLLVWKEVFIRALRANQTSDLAALYRGGRDHSIGAERRRRAEVEQSCCQQQGAPEYKGSMQPQA